MKTITLLMILMFLGSAYASERNHLTCTSENPSSKVTWNFHFMTRTEAQIRTVMEIGGTTTDWGPLAQATITEDEEFRYTGFSLSPLDTVVLLFPHVLFEDQDQTMKVEMVSTISGNNRMVDCTNINE